MGSGGCLLTELPSLTVLYNTEQSVLELTSDCGLGGTKRIACKGNVVGLYIQWLWVPINKPLILFLLTNCKYLYARDERHVSGIRK